MDNPPTYWGKTIAKKYLATAISHAVITTFLAVCSILSVYRNLWIGALAGIFAAAAGWEGYKSYRNLRNYLNDSTQGIIAEEAAKKALETERRQFEVWYQTKYSNVETRPDQGAESLGELSRIHEQAWREYMDEKDNKSDTLD